MRKLLLIVILIIVAQKANCQYWLIFYADVPPKSYGHGFVSFIRGDNQSKQTVLDGCWGFYPKDESNENVESSLFGPVESAMKDDIKRQREFGFTVKVNLDEYYSALETKDEWTSKGYMGSIQNCKDFIYAVANNVTEIKQPLQTWRFPHDYIKDLKRLNPSLEVKGPLEFDEQNTPLNTFKILPEWVTHPTDKKFKWYIYMIKHLLT